MVGDFNVKIGNHISGNQEKYQGNQKAQKNN